MTVRWGRLLPGFAATMMGIGFSRFSFTPLSALMVEKHLLTSQDITIIAAFMMAAYAIGAFTSTTLSSRFGAVPVVRACFVIISLGLLAEGVFAAFLPVLAGRFVMSVAGAVLMVLGPGMILSTLSPQQRGFAAGFVFTGIGFGVLIAGTLVAMIANSPVVIVGLVMFTVAAGVSGIGWNQWPENAVENEVERAEYKTEKMFSAGFLGLLLAYAFDAVAFIPHTVYLSDFIASELGHGAGAGGAYWAVFGIGGILGAASSAWLRKQLGGQLSLELVIATKALFIGVLGFATSLPIVAISAFVVGALVPGVVMLVSTRTAELVGPQNIVHAWGIMTGAFAIGQFVGATGMSVAYLSLTRYQPLFAIGGLLEALALVVLIISIRFLPSQSKGNLQ